MTIKAWNIPSEWQEPFVAKLSERGAGGRVVNAALAAIDDRCTETGEDPHALFGDPQEYAATVILPETKAAQESSVRAVVLAVIGLIGMFLALWGWRAVENSADKLIGMPPMVVFVVGAVLCLGAAIADAVLGNKADVIHEGPGRTSAKALLLNRLGPWIIVALTLLGMLIISLTVD